jgi:hypothetical protein
VVTRGSPLTVRLSVTNGCEDALPTRGATALIYFVERAGN